jgi:hypothetical protein
MPRAPPGARHRRPDRDQPSGVLRGPHLVASLATAMVYGFGGIHGGRRECSRSAPSALTRAARAPLRPAHGDLQRPRRHHDRARVLRAGLRGPRPPAARRRGGRTPSPAAGGPGRGGTARCVLPLPVRRRGVPRLPGGPPPSGDRLGGGGGAAARHRPHRRAGAARRPGRPERCRQDDPHRAGRAALRPDAGLGPDQRRGPARRHTGLAQRPRSGWSPRRRTSSTTPSAPTSRTPPGGHRRADVGALEAAQVRPGGVAALRARHRRRRPGHRLSGGEKQRLAIARLLLKEPRPSSSSTRRPRTWTPRARRSSSGHSPPRCATVGPRS